MKMEGKSPFLIAGVGLAAILQSFLRRGEISTKMMEHLRL